MSYVITTESNSEIPFEWEDRYGIRVLRMPYTIEGEEIFYDLGRETDIGAFFKRMRDGAVVTTAARNPDEIREYFEPHLKAGNDILHIAFSSALSGTFGNEKLVAAQLMEEYPERKIILVDTLAISMPLGQLVKRALDMKESGSTMEEIAQWVEDNKMRSCALFVVDSLEYLRRGGRVSNASAFFGTALQIKPVLHISKEGKIVPVAKVKGKKKAVKYILDKCAETIENPQEQTVYILQADCMDEAMELKKQVEELIKPKEVVIAPVGPVIGSHAGPGTIALVYFTSDRDVLK